MTLKRQIDRSSVEAKRDELSDLMRARSPAALDSLRAAQRIDITYTSNALEGNTLTAGETALVLESGITIAGKPLKDHLEALDHAHALDWVEEIARDQAATLTENVVRDLHRLVMARSAPEIAGAYADRARYVNTAAGPHRFPAPVDIGPMMNDFARWMADAERSSTAAFEAHRRLVAIHPFNDGNGRTARLLMNLMLIRSGFPPIAIRPEDRVAYLSALERSQAAGDHEPFHQLLHERLDRALDLHIRAAKDAVVVPRS